MTGKQFDKDIFAILFMTILTIVALIFGFTSVPSPSEQRNIDLDQKRVVDLGDIAKEIDNYYPENKVLPASLEDIKSYSNSKYSSSYSVFSITDPETNKPYEYTKTGDKNYKLCAEFKTDTTNAEAKTDNNPNNYEYETYKKDYKHQKGFICFEKKVIASNTYIDNNNYNYNYIPVGPKNEKPIPAKNVSISPTSQYTNPTTSPSL